MQAGRHFYIEQGKADKLAIRLLVDETAVALAGSQFVTLYAPGGAELLARTSTGVTTSSNVATLAQTWTTATYPRDYGYKAVWELSDGATTYERIQFFEVVRRRFRSTLEDSDITALHPYVTEQNQQSSLALYKRESWEEIALLCRARIPSAPKQRTNMKDFTGGRISSYVGNFFNPEDFRIGHLYLCLSWFFDHNSFGSADQNQLRAENYRKRGLDAIDLALSKIAFDRDDDGLEDFVEEDFDFGVVRLAR